MPKKNLKKLMKLRSTGYNNSDKQEQLKKYKEYRYIRTAKEMKC